MLQSKLFAKTLKSSPTDEVAKNAQLLTRAGFVYKNSSGVYTYLPFGLRVIEKINAVIREEMNVIGGMELFMPALVDRKYLEATDRFKLDVGFDVLGKEEKEPNFVLGWTHEEVITAIVSNYINSYNDLPFAVYQIQTKFRNEPRAKSGLLRGKEFLMKDLYSFHESEKDLFNYYEKVKEAYGKVFKRCGLEFFYTLAGGGDFTISNTHEFQVLADIGEDVILYCRKCRYAENRQLPSELKEGQKCVKCQDKISEANAIEVGNIFPLGTKYSEAFGLNFQDKKGVKKPVVMGSYGIGVGRVMASIVEVHSDRSGIIWPKEVSPFLAHLLSLSSGSAEIKNKTDKIYLFLKKNNIDVLYDDREETTAGEKFADADLIGLPYRIIVSKRTIADNSVEIKKRDEKKVKLVKLNNIVKLLHG